MLQSTKYARKPFFVDAIQVTEDNISEVAEWCQGEVRTSETPGEDDSEEERYIKVRVHRPLTDRQTKAYIGDWVLYAVTGFKVYPTKAFHQSFEPADDGSVKHKKKAKTYRDAGSGEYVDEEYADLHPDTTVSEESVEAMTFVSPARESAGRKN
jgi:hypothetical protein